MPRVLLVLITVLAFVLLPHLVSAAVLINEIAWMGGLDSPNDEWIELFNDSGSSVDVHGWQLTDNVSLTIMLSGSLDSGQYVLLERTDDESAPGTAFHVYSGALGNDGRTLTLRRSDGSIADQVAGGEGWQSVGGNNTTKDTAQLTDAGWITAVPTPGRQNSTVATEGVSGGETATHTTGNSGAKTNVSFGQKTESLRTSLQHSDTKLTLTAPEGIVTFPGREVSFEVQAGGIGDTIINMVDYEWNFGDGSTSTKRSPVHAYAFPGTYVVVTRGNVLRHEAVARSVVTVLPYRFSLEHIDDRVFIHNDAAYEADVGELALTDGVTRITIPKDTLLLPRASLTLGAATFKHPHLLVLQQKDGTILARNEPPTQQFHRREPNIRAIERTTEPHQEEVGQQGVQSAATTTATSSRPEAVPTTSETTTTAQLPASMQAGKSGDGSRLPILGLLGVIGLGLLATFAPRTR